MEVVWVRGGGYVGEQAEEEEFLEAEVGDQPAGYHSHESEHKEAETGE